MITHFFQKHNIIDTLNKNHNFDIIDNSIKNIHIEVPSNSSSCNIFICKFDNDENKKVVFRTNIDERFKFLMTVNTKGIFPQILIFNKQYNYCVEKYINGSQLEFVHLCDIEIVTKIINKIQQLHNITTNKNEYLHIPLFCNILEIQYSNVLRLTKNMPEFDNIHLLYKYIEYCQDNFINNSSIDNSQIVISHNDIRIGSLINSENDIVIINPEHMCFNHWVYDFVNLMEETRIYFNKNEVDLFVRSDCLNQFDEFELSALIYNIDEIIISAISQTHNICIDLARKYVATYRIYPNIFWYLWGIEKYYETYDIKFWKYACVRWNRICELL